MPNQKDSQHILFQSLIDKQYALRTELRQLEGQIEDFESNYFQKNWNDGNIVLGWSKVSVPPPPSNAPKIKLLPKDKPFSLSSATSEVNLELGDIADKNLTPFPEHRFQTAKKRKNKKSKIFSDGRNRGKASVRRQGKGRPFGKKKSIRRKRR